MKIINKSQAVLFAAGFLGLYVLLQIIRVHYFPNLFLPYPNLLLIPYGTIVFTGLTYYLSRDTKQTVHTFFTSLLILSILVATYIAFPKYNTLITFLLDLTTLSYMLYKFFYKKVNA